MTATVSPEIPLHKVAELGRSLDLQLDALRSVNPIVWSDVNRAWIVTGNAEVAEGYSGKLPLSAYRFPHVTLGHIAQDDQRKHLSTLTNAVQDWINNNDGPKHLRLRKLVSNAFGKKVVDDIRPYTKRIIQETLDAVAHREEIEFVNEIAVPVPGLVTLKLLGLPERLLPDLKRWSQIITKMANINTPLEELIDVNALLPHFRDMLNPEFEKRRHSPSNDFLSALVTANDAGDQLSDEEMFSICDVTLIGGYDSISNRWPFPLPLLPAILTLSITFVTIPETQKILLWNWAVARGCPRYRAGWQRKILIGKLMRSGRTTSSCCSNSAANRDPQFCPDPDAINFQRAQYRNISFGGGPHFCVGACWQSCRSASFCPSFLDDLTSNYFRTNSILVISSGSGACRSFRSVCAPENHNKLCYWTDIDCRWRI